MCYLKFNVSREDIQTDITNNKVGSFIKRFQHSFLLIKHKSKFDRKRIQSTGSQPQQFLPRYFIDHKAIKEKQQKYLGNMELNTESF